MKNKSTAIKNRNSRAYKPTGKKKCTKCKKNFNSESLKARPDDERDLPVCTKCFDKLHKKFQNQQIMERNRQRNILRRLGKFDELEKLEKIHIGRNLTDTPERLIPNLPE